MPKSKRNKVISLTKVKKRSKDSKDKLIEAIRDSTSRYGRCYLISIDNERNTFMQEVRRRMHPGRLFCAKNKVMQLALGSQASSECQDNIHKISERITGKNGLLFVDKDPAEVLGFFADYHPLDYARSGATATATVTLPRGTDALAKLPHSIEAHLRQLGLPTQLKEGRIHLLGEHTVCRHGQEISADAAQVLKLLDIKQAQFSVSVEAHWTRATGVFVDCNTLED
jgi:mRNA turnover protein 4|eukprot:TRINITY_DN45847_c0_g1_i1.p1 TRINITY_DN45847_c0_g1~~TRINITY_DN45847_c0_g1_i1.p1  ORF type:complete len:238 (+),score=33.76 TRINITY_DN45847_c0_g1_i1:39-716(+)